MDLFHILPSTSWGHAHDGYVRAINRFGKEGALEQLAISRIALIWVIVFSVVEFSVHASMAILKFTASVIFLRSTPPMYKPHALFDEAVSHVVRATKVAVALVFVPLFGLLSTKWSVDLCDKLSLVKRPKRHLWVVKEVLAKATAVWKRMNDQGATMRASAFTISALAAYLIIKTRFGTFTHFPQPNLHVRVSRAFYMGLGMCLVVSGMYAYSSWKNAQMRRLKHARIDQIFAKVPIAVLTNTLVPFLTGPDRERLSLCQRAFKPMLQVQDLDWRQMYKKAYPAQKWIPHKSEVESGCWVDQVRNDSIDDSVVAWDKLDFRLEEMMSIRYRLLNMTTDTAKHPAWRQLCYLHELHPEFFYEPYDSQTFLTFVRRDGRVAVVDWTGHVRIWNKDGTHSEYPISLQKEEQGMAEISISPDGGVVANWYSGMVDK